ncbi:MAG TPA: tetratricopeptide repeat protein [Opitutaceae bacterium]|jgi:Flp pilus assembly protein TadD
MPTSTPSGSTLFPKPKPWQLSAALVIATFAAYIGVWRAGFIWDDNFHVTRTALRSLHGLWRTWFEFGATEQYYPVLHSAFWVEHAIWGDSAACYHVLNVGLHAAAALILQRILKVLGAPGSWLAAFAFALHPVCAESVAWISEQKNTLSTVFYLAAALQFLRFEGDRKPARYAAAFALFVLAILSKSVTVTLPAALLVAIWWKRGSLRWRRDVLLLLPWLAVAAADASVTAWVERTFVGAKGSAFGLTLVQKVLLCGHAMWFYAAKVVWPSPLVFIYPRWTIDAHAWSQWLFPAGAVAALIVLLALRWRSRGPLAVALIFVGTLSPALGFVNVYPFIYSYVADHFQYLAAAFLISGICAGAATLADRIGGSANTALTCISALALLVLGLATSRQVAKYESDETLWRTTIAQNQGTWMAHENLGNDLMQDGDGDGAIQEFRSAIGLRPDDVDLENDLAIALMRAGKTEEAAAEFRRVLAAQPGDTEAHNNLGNLYAQLGNIDAAIAEYRQAERADTGDIGPHYNLANLLMQAGRVDEAVSEYRAALRVNPHDPDSHYNLGLALARKGDDAAAVEQFRGAVDADPSYEGAHLNLGAILLKRSKPEEAIAEFEKAVGLKPDDDDARFDLGTALFSVGQIDKAITQFRAVVEARPDDRQAHQALGAALLKKGLVDEADSEFQKATQR